jgi:hypothetical protein
LTPRSSTPFRISLATLKMFCIKPPLCELPSLSRET